MPRWLKSLLLVLAFGWVVVVYAPYLRGIGPGSGGFLGSDLTVLVEAAGGAETSRLNPEPVPLQDMGARAYLAAGGERGSILTGASLAFSRRLWGVSESSATLYRLENLLLLLVAGLGLANFIRRLLLPWTGADHARAAARALPAVLFLHPFAVHAVADLSGRADLLYLAFGSWAAASYLRARQDRKPTRLIVACLLFLAAHLSGRFGLGLSLAIAVGEFASVQRYQPRRRRWSRALTTFVVFGMLASTELFVRSALGGTPQIVRPFSPGAGSFFERFGILLLPVPTPGLTMALAVVLILGAMHPAMRAARWAPRLWGRLLGVWFAALCLTLFFGGPAPGGHVGLGDFSRVGTLFPSAVVLVAGLVVVATGVQGFLRLVLPIGLAVGFGLLSLSQAPMHMRAARATAHLRGDLEAAATRAGELRVELAREGRGSVAGPALLALRDPSEEEALDPFSGGIEHLLDASLTGHAPEPNVQRPRLLTSAAFVALAREPEFDELRRGGAVVVAEHELVTLGVPQSFVTPPLWRGTASLPDLDLDPLTISGLVVTLPSERTETGAALPESVSFSSRGASEPRHAAGLWLDSGGRTEGLFDLSSQLDWLLGGRIGRVGFDAGLARVEVGAFRPRSYASGDVLEPEVEDGDWRFPVPPAAARLQPIGSVDRDEFVLGILDLRALSLVELVADRSQDGVLLFPRAQAKLDAWSRGEVAFTLERRVDGRTIWRHSGRLSRP
jgi:hypothetical protein